MITILILGFYLFVEFLQNLLLVLLFGVYNNFILEKKANYLSWKLPWRIKISIIKIQMKIEDGKITVRMSEILIRMFPT